MLNDEHVELERSQSERFVVELSVKVLLALIDIHSCRLVLIMLQHIGNAEVEVVQDAFRTLLKSMD
jgi:hypothetical protein